MLDFSFESRANIMMINCPNCNLLQPKDQYCAGCGVNMETWKPPKQPTWKKIASNWMFQLGVLFSLIFALVLKDSFSDKPSTSYQESSIPVAESIPRDQSQNFSSSRQESQNQERAREQQVQNTQTANTLGASLQEETTTTRQFYRRAALKVSLMNRALIDKIAEKSQKLEENFFLIKKEDITEITGQNPQDIQSLGKTRANFEFNQDSTLFLGETDNDTDLKLGFFVQINVNETSNADKIQYEISSWNQLQLNGEQGPRASLEINSPTRSFLVIVDPSPHDISFTPEESTLFESSNRLRRLNNEAFQEGLSDIVLVLEIK